ALGVCLRVAWRTLVLSGRDPTQILDCLQEVLIRERHRPEVFATVATLSVDIASCDGVIYIAGHPPPVLLGSTLTTLGDGRAGPPLGLFDEEWPAVPVALGREWSLMLYTDGLIEGKGGPDGTVLGPEGLLSLVTAASPGSSVHGFEDALADTLLKTVERLIGGPLADDVAFIIVGHHS
ncbi:MAG: PP2C family protein-serine/threonine phosphatase, partial [Streptosporangiaceae bacterium]